jgi:hypothetical protein
MRVQAVFSHPGSAHISVQIPPASDYPGCCVGAPDYNPLAILLYLLVPLQGSRTSVDSDTRLSIALKLSM